MKINLREKIQEIINRHEVISLRFKKAEQEGPVKGFGLPLGSLQGRLSGLRFMLCGDAGSLIDPATGEGIGNAMLSGMIAANRAVSCFEKNDFSVSFLSGYDREVYGRLAKEFRSKYRLQQLIGSKPFIADWAIGAAQKFPWIKNRMQKLF
jgi:flavin-dependent dehydrogenase